MNILITGGAGYLGSKLAKKISESNEHAVTIVDNLLFNQWYLVQDALKNCVFKHIDVRNMSKDFIRSFDIIIPLAALVGAPICNKYPRDAKEINKDAIKYLCDNVIKDQFIIFMNTNSGYGRVIGKICTEETPLHSISLYGQTKDEAEQLVIKHHKSTVFRLATLFGLSYRPRLDLLINTMVYEAITKKKITVFDGDFNRNYVHIDDVVDTILYAINNSNRFIGEIFNIGNDTINCTKFNLAKIIQKLCGCDIEIIKQTDPDQRDYIVSSEKLKKKTGTILKKSLEYGINEMSYFCKYLSTESEKSMRNI
jgi:nucleoside-diphosphate-sugar epimerase